MIHRPRPAQSLPKSLDPDTATSAGAKELQKVKDWFTARAANPAAPRPGFTAYKGADVSEALENLFERKCAYCESPYVSLHPVDIEHWRPKAEVEVDGTIIGGYEWLAMVWENLLPSCIDCNRARYQMIPDADGGWKREKIGKANQFPIADPAARWIYGAASSEKPLLLDPCVDKPTEYFDFESSGVLLPKAGLAAEMRDRAVQSIRVCGLNRKGLVDERRRHVLRLELVFDLVRFLYTASADVTLPAAFRNAANTLVAETLDRLRESALPGVPYSQFLARRLETFLREELGAG